MLALEREDGRADWVAAHRLVDLLHQARPMPRLVVLNSCSGAAAGVSDLFSGTAAALVRGGVSAVAAMQYEISDPAAVAFARGFYAAIARGRSVDDAISSGRVAILGLGDKTLEWVTPVLYLRGHDSRLFTLPARLADRSRDNTEKTDVGAVGRSQADDAIGPSFPPSDMTAPEDGDVEDFGPGTPVMVGQTACVLGEQAEVPGRSTEHEDPAQPGKRRRRNLLLLAGALVASALAVSLALVFVPGSSASKSPGSSASTSPESSTSSRPRTTTRTIAHPGPPPLAVLAGRAVSVAFSPNGADVAAGTSSGLVREWDVDTRAILHSMADPDSDGVNDIAFSYDNALLATADANGKVYLWGGGKVAQTLTDPSGRSVLSVAFSSDMANLAIGDADGNVYVCQLAGDTCGAFSSPEPDPDSDGVTSLAFNPQDNVLAAGDANGKIFMWIHFLGNTIDDPSGSAIRSVAFTPDDRLLVAGDAAGRVYEWAYTSSGNNVIVGKDPVLLPGGSGQQERRVGVRELRRRVRGGSRRQPPRLPMARRHPRPAGLRRPV